VLRNHPSLGSCNNKYNIPKNSKMNILIACDSFKDALPALEVCQAIARGLQKGGLDAQPILFPLADGGEGTAQILTYHSGGEMVTKTVKGPSFQPVEAAYGLAGDGKTAFIEMAAAAGLQLLSPEERNPLKTTTYGLGELILDSLSRGAERILLGIGGSATNDAGLGMATALGYRFLDEQGEGLLPIGGNLSKIRHIDCSQACFRPGEIVVEVLCDVRNPLYGSQGAAQVYAPQKGADEEAVRQLDAGLQHFAGLLEQAFGRDFARQPGAGAAGGLGAGAMAFLGAALKPGIETVMAATGFEERLQRAQLVITGEGKLDAQTLQGKLIQGIARQAGTRGIPVIALCGALLASPAEIAALGLQAAFSIQPRPASLPDALAATAENLEQTAFNLARVLMLKALAPR
jgi:glycerate 2-kinase